MASLDPDNNKHDSKDRMNGLNAVLPDYCAWIELNKDTIDITVGALGNNAIEMGCY